MTLPGTYIGIIDSGVGGLTVYHQLKAQMPHENFVYLADAARLPYGNKDQETLNRYGLEMAHYLSEHYPLKALVVACGTLSACSLETLKNALPIPVFGMIEAGIRTLLNHVKGPHAHVAILATKATARSHIYQKRLKESGFQGKVSEVGCQLFVALAEEGLYDHPITHQTTSYYLETLEKPHALLLACTHFPLLKTAIKKQAGGGILVLDPAFELALQVKESFYKGPKKQSHTVFLTTKDPYTLASAIAHIQKEQCPVQEVCL